MKWARGLINAVKIMLAWLILTAVFAAATILLMAY